MWKSPGRCHQTQSPVGSQGEGCDLGDTRVTQLARGRLWDQTWHIQRGLERCWVGRADGTARAGDALRGWGYQDSLGVPPWPLKIPGNHPKTERWWPEEGFRDSSQNLGACGHLGAAPEGRGSGPSGGGSLVPRIREGTQGWGHPRALQPPRDAEIPINYLASVFINQQFLCKQTHPEPLLLSPWQQHRADPGSGGAPGSHLGHSPACDFLSAPFPPPRSLQAPGPSQHWILTSLMWDH